MQKYLFCGIDANKVSIMLKGALKLLFGLSILLAIQSCQSSSVKEDVSAYCDCIHGELSFQVGECVELREEIIRKYEYDPEALIEIEKELLDCNSK